MGMRLERLWLEKARNGEKKREIGYGGGMREEKQQTGQFPRIKTFGKESRH